MATIPSTILPQLLKRLALGGHAQSVEFSPDGRSIAAGCIQRSMSLYDVASLKRTKQIKGMPGDVYRVAWFPDCQRVVAGGLAKKVGWVAVIDAQTGDIINQLETQSDVYVLAVSPDGTSLVAGCIDGELIRWDTRNWQRTELMPNHPGTNAFSFGDAAFAPDGARLISAQRIGELRTNAGHVTSWDTASWKMVRSVPLQCPHSLALSPDGKTLAASDYHGVTFLDAATLEIRGNVQVVHGGPSHYMGRKHLIMGPNRERLRLISIEAKEVIAILDTMSHLSKYDEVDVGVFAVSPDGQLAATVGPKLDVWKLPAV